MLFVLAAPSSYALGNLELIGTPAHQARGGASTMGFERIGKLVVEVYDHPDRRQDHQRHCRTNHDGAAPLTHPQRMAATRMKQPLTPEGGSTGSGAAQRDEATCLAGGKTAGHEENLDPFAFAG